MRTLTKTGIRILSAKYRSILIKCAIINASVFIGAFGSASVMAGNLPAVIQDKNISSYTLTNGDETLTSDLGTLAGSGRIFTINGNGHALKGADTHAGIALEEGQTLTLDNVNMEYFQSGDYGGAVYNNGGTITGITGNFKNNSSTDLDGGAIANDGGTIANITGNFEGNSAYNGGAINNVGNSSNITITASTGDIQFKDNYAKDSGGHGGAINSDARSTVNIIASGGNITFDGNYLTSSSGKGGAIYNYNNSTVGLYADKDHMISFVGGTETDKYDIDGIYNAGTLNVNGNVDDKVYAGTVNLYNVAGTGTTNIYGGTVNALADIAQSATNVNNATLKLGIVGTGEDARAVNVSNLNLTNYAKLDAYNGHIDTTAIKSITGTNTVKFDVDLANKTGDYNNSDTFNITTFVDGSKLGFELADVNFISDMDSAYGKIKLADKNIGTGAKTVNSNVADSQYKYLFKASNSDGSIDILRGLKNGLREYLHGEVTPASDTYTMTEDDYMIQNLGTMTVNELTVDGTDNHYGIIGNDFSGAYVGNEKTLTIKNVGELNPDGSVKSSINGFVNSAGGFIIVQSGGTVNIENSVLSSNIVSKSNTWGGVIFNMSNATLNATDSVFIDNQAVKDDSNGSGGAIYNSSNATTNILAKDKDVIFRGNISGDGTSGAIYNVGTLGLYAKETKEIALEGTKDGVVSSTADTIFNSGTMNINGNFESVDYKGAINLVGVTGENGTTNIYGGTVNVKNDAVFNQSTLNNQGIFNFNGTTGQVTNLADAETAKGTTNIYTGSFTVKHTTIQDKITVAKDAILTLGDDDGYSEINEISNDGTLNLYDANIKQIIGTGTTTIYSMATMDAGITQDNLIIDGNFNTYLVVSADGLNIKNGIINNGTLELTDGVLTSDVSGNGKIQIASDKVTNHANISNRIGNYSEFVNNGNIENSEFVNFIGSSLVNNNYIKTTFFNNVGIVDNNGKIIADEIENKSVAGLNMSSGSVIQGNIYGGTINSNGTNTVIGSIQDAEENPVNLCLNSGTLNMSGEISVSSTTADGGSLGLINNNISTANLGNLSLDNNMNISIDAHLANETMDQLNVTSVSGSGNIVISDIKLLSDANDDYMELSLFADGTTTDVYNKVSGNLNGLAYSSTYKYDALYDSATGMIGFTRYNSGTSDDFNPYLYAPSGVANTTAAMTTQIATLAMDKMDDAVYTQGRSGGDTPTSSNVWVKVMGLNDNVEFKNFENIDSKALTVAAGYNTNKITCGDNSVVFGAYAGYIGGKQHYTANDIDQNGGYVGLSSALTLRNAFLTATVNGGLLKNKANNMYGTDEFRTLWLGTGLKAGYNYAITDSVVLQPNVYGGYTLVNTEDYTSVSGAKIATNNLNFFEVDPGLKLSVVIADGWTGSVQGKYAIVMDNGADITANDIALQNISTKNYIEYGIGIDKSVTDAFYLGAKVNRHDGGRTGWNGSIEFRYKF